MSSQHRLSALTLFLGILALKVDANWDWRANQQSHDSVTKRPYIKHWDRPPGPGPHGYEIQYIGYQRYVTPQEEMQRNHCSSFFCINDAFYLFTKSSQYLGLDACNDFKNFSVDHVVQVDVPDDRQQSRGFIKHLSNLYYERMRKVAAASKFIKVNKPETNRIVKVVRNHFRQCLKSPLVLRHLQAHRDILEHLQSLGGAPHIHKHLNFNPELFDEEKDFGRLAIQERRLRFDFDAMDGEWDAEKFNISRLFEAETWHSLLLFFDLEVRRCAIDFVCLKRFEAWTYIDDGKFVFEAFSELFNTLEDFYLGLRPLKTIIDEKYYKPAVDRERAYLNRKEELKMLVDDKNTTKIRIKDLQRLMPKEFHVNWLNLINSELLEESRVTEDEEILIEGGIKLLWLLAKNLVEMDKRTIADTFATTFLYGHRLQIVLRFHNKQALGDHGYKKGWQRWITCLRQASIEEYMGPALIVMYEQQRPIWDRTLGDLKRNSVDERADILGSAEKMVREVIAEYKRRFIKAPNLPPHVAFDVLHRLKDIQIVMSLNSKIFPAELLEEFYKELPLDGDENFLESTWAMWKNHRKILNEPRQSWRRQIDRMVYAQSNNWVTYKIEDGNILYVPPRQVLYPFFHPSRPRFFNMATLYAHTFSQINKGVKKYVKNRYKIAYNATCCEEETQIAYEVYSDWLKNNTDLQVGANYLTNKQLYWVARAINLFAKYHRAVPNATSSVNRLQNDYLHVYYKRNEGFQDAFNCTLTEKEKLEYDEYLEKYRKLNS